ncbi:hypothetical protein SCLCIDRAFT_1207051 [Scleroderma citrinum Foug A]|uniref:Uncharacterized protein n=1 Tax=Scleroderma citrinum Foug A TaxID=1036808 RepID=A0A0C3AAR3_9AGAM|nr:hypothetical protein SCLCIDRAFT_1207051 [Scleroderma citrinum Foug A]
MNNGGSKKSATLKYAKEARHTCRQPEHMWLPCVLNGFLTRPAWPCMKRKYSCLKSAGFGV